MTEQKFHEATEMQKKIREFAGLIRYAKMYKGVNEKDKLSIMIKSPIDDIVIDDVSVIAEMFKTVYEFCLHKTEKLEAEFKKL